MNATDSPGPKEEHIAPETHRPPAPKKDNWQNVWSTALLLLAAFLLAVFIKAYLLQPYVVDGQSMEPTLQNGDRLVVNKIPETLSHIGNHQYVPSRGDIIIFNQANLPGYYGTKQLIKRVIGLPGERVVVKSGVITVYNKANPKGFNPDTSTGYQITAPATLGNIDVTLGSHEIFVCGDNRANSEDSRYFGPVNTGNIVGKLIVRIFPISHAERF